MGRGARPWRDRRLERPGPPHAESLCARSERRRIQFRHRCGRRGQQETLEYAETKGPLTSPEYLRALALVRQLARAQGIDATIQAHKLDAIVAPTESPAWLIDVLLGDNTVQGSYVVAAAVGYPSITVPAGDVAGLPVGVLFMGPAWSEGTLLKLAFSFEQRVRARRAPTFQPSIQVRP